MTCPVCSIPEPAPAAPLSAAELNPKRAQSRTGSASGASCDFGTCSPLVDVGGAARFARYVSGFLPVRSLRALSVLHLVSLEQTLERIVDFKRLGKNTREQRVALGVVATPAHQQQVDGLSLGRRPATSGRPAAGHRLRRDSQAAPRAHPGFLCDPALFPAVRVTTPTQADGWLLRWWPALDRRAPGGPLAARSTTRLDRAASGDTSALRPPQLPRAGASAAPCGRGPRAPRSRHAHRTQDPQLTRATCLAGR